MIAADLCARLARHCRERAGLTLADDKPYLFETRLGPVARRLGYNSAAAFAERIAGGLDEAQTWAAVAALAPSDTSFFRDRPVFETLERAIIPNLVARFRQGPLRVWSAGCASGQEPYSLAMILADAKVRPAAADILATDICVNGLETAQSGLYSQFEVQRGLPIRRLVTHFENQGDGFAVSPRLKELIHWRPFNLTDDPTPLGRFDLILCRHVLASLAPELRPPLVARLVERLTEGGVLVLSPDDACDLPLAGPGIYARSDVGVAAA